jgi:hypothetical protein
MTPLLKENGAYKKGDSKLATATGTVLLYPQGVVHVKTSMLSIAMFGVLGALFFRSKAEKRALEGGPGVMRWAFSDIAQLRRESFGVKKNCLGLQTVGGELFRFENSYDKWSAAIRQAAAAQGVQMTETAEGLAVVR